MQILKSMHNCYNGSLYIQGIKIQFLQFKNAQNVNELIFNISLLLCKRLVLLTTLVLMCSLRASSVYDFQVKQQSTFVEPDHFKFYVTVPSRGWSTKNTKHI